LGQYPVSQRRASGGRRFLFEVLAVLVEHANEHDPTIPGNGKNASRSAEIS